MIGGMLGVFPAQGHVLGLLRGTACGAPLGRFQPIKVGGMGNSSNLELNLIQFYVNVAEQRLIDLLVLCYSLWLGTSTVKPY